MVVSSLATYKAYLAQAQTYFTAGNYDASRQQVVLARMELAKIPDVEAGGEKATFERDLKAIEDAITDIQARSLNRRNQMQFGTITPAATGPAFDQVCR